MTDQTVSNRRVLAIAIPIVLSNITVPLLGAVDTGVVGQLGLAAPIGAVGLGAIILSAIYWVFGFLRMGTTGLTSQANGAGNRDEVSALLMRSFLIAAAGGVAVILLQLPLFWGALQMAPASPEVENMAHTYMRIRVWSAPAVIALYGINGWLIALERTAAVLMIQVVMNGLNIILDIWFVLGLGWGVEGVAIATLIAELAGLLVGLWFCWRALKGTVWWNKNRIFDRERVVHMAVVNTDILIRSLLLQAIFVSFLFLGSDFGDVTLAANQVLTQFLQITAFGLDGFAFAAEALVGTAMGAGNVAMFRRSTVLASIWGVLTCVALSLFFWLYGGWMIDVLTTSTEVRAEARVYLIYMVVSPILGVLPWMLDGVFIGATRTKDMRNMMAVSFIVYVASVWALVPQFGNHGLWLALLISFVARGVTLVIKYPALERSVGSFRNA
jgi:multidrug resistance protein, MATE family